MVPNQAAGGRVWLAASSHIALNAATAVACAEAIPALPDRIAITIVAPWPGAR